MSLFEFILVVLAGLMPITAIVVLATIARRRHVPADQRSVQVINEAVERLSQATVHHVEVNAVLALTQQFRARPELLASLSDYSRELVGAALLARVNALGNDVSVVVKQLSVEERRVANGYTSHQADVARLSARRDELLAEIVAADQAIQEFSLIPTT